MSEVASEILGVNKGDVMDEIDMIANEATEGMSLEESLVVAEKMESIARIIRQRVCGACGQHCRKSSCWRQPPPQSFSRN